MDINKTLVINNVDQQQTVSETIQFALLQTTSQNFDDVVKKNKLLKKLNSENVEGFSSDEIQIIKAACLKVLLDGATIAIMEEIAPNDLI